MARNSGARNTRNFADTVSMSASPTPATHELHAEQHDRQPPNSAARRLVAMPQGMKTAKPMHA